MSLRRFLALILMLAVPFTAAAVSSQTLRLYTDAQQALAAGDLEAGRAALRALAERGDGDVRALAADAASASTLADARARFARLSQAASNWTLPAGYVLVICEKPESTWVQREGRIANPIDGSDCGSVVETRYSQEITVRGYLNTYSDGETLSATRISASLMDIPLAVTPLTRDLMTDQNVTDVDDVMHNAPAVTPILGLLRPNYYVIRGFYVMNYRDGVRTPIDGTVPLDPAAIERIEILKGPSTILYGKGDPGGIINFLSRRPSSSFSGSANVSYGTEGVRRGSVDVTGALGENVAGRLIVSNDASESFRDEVTSDVLYVNPSLSIGLGAKTNLWITGEYTTSDTIMDQGIFVRYGGEIPALSTREHFYGNDGDYWETSGNRLQAELETQVTPAWTLRAIAGRESYQQDMLWTWQLVDSGPTGYLGLIPPNQLYQVRFDEHPDRYHNTARIESTFAFDLGTTKHQFLAAADYREDVEDLMTDILDYQLFDYVTEARTTNIFGIPFGQGYLFEERTRTHATGKDIGFAVQDLIEVTPRLNLLAGIRLENNTITADRTGFQRINGALGAPPVSLDAHPDDSKTDNVAPRLGVVYKIAPSTSLYASYLTAFISPVPGILTQAGDPLDPESSRQYEAGVKVSFLEDRLLLTASAFDIAKNDAFVFYGTYGENAGLEESSGFEIDLIGALTDRINVMAGYSATNMEFVKGEARLVGKTRPGVPEHAANFWGVWNAPDGPLSGFSAGVGAYYIGDVWISYTNSSKLPSYTAIDGMVAYRFGSWRLQANLQNLTDAEGYSPSSGYAGGNDPNLTPGMAMPIGPRRLVLNVTYGF
jgi:iron complex outermembrane receptor protein